MTKTFTTSQIYVQRFTITYCAIILVFSCYFTPQDFNLKVSLIVNLLFVLIGTPFWLRNSKIPVTYLNSTAQISNSLAMVWVCSFLGPTSHANLVAIPQFILVFMMFPHRHFMRYVLSVICLFLLLLPQYPFVNEWYLHKRMPENALAILRSVMDLAVLIMCSYQFKVVVDSWNDALLTVENDKKKLQEESTWRHKLLKILSHDVKEPMVLTLHFLRKLHRKNLAEADVQIINQIESAQTVIRDVISNVELFSAKEFDHKLPLQATTFECVVQKIRPWINSRLAEKGIQIIPINSLDRFPMMINEDSFAYQIFNNLISNAIKFSPRDATIELSEQHLGVDHVRWIIRDFGPGIKPEAFKNEFFTELGSAGEKGSGLGIKIASIFAQNSGITITWHSAQLNSNIDFIGTEIHITQNCRS